MMEAAASFEEQTILNIRERVRDGRVL